MKLRSIKGTLFGAVVAVSTSLGTWANAATVDTVLSLVIDVSGSVSASEYNLQMDGYAAAFRDSAIQNGILDTGGGDLGRIAVNVIQFSSNAVQSIGFTILDSITSINNFADALDTLARSSSGLTDIASGMNLARTEIANWLLTNSASRLVMDVSGDGSSNDGGSVTAARDAAIAAGITVNGLPILGSESGLFDYYNNNVVGGTGSFIVAANDFASFEGAVKKKLRAEITGGVIPLPAGLPLMAGGLLIFGFVARRRKSMAA